MCFSVPFLVVFLFFLEIIVWAYRTPLSVPHASASECSYTLKLSKMQYDALVEKKKKRTRVLRVCLPTTHPMQPQRVGPAKFWGVLYHSHMTIEFITQNEMMKVFWRSQGASSHWCKSSSDAVLSWTRSPAHGVTDCIESRNEKLTFSIMAQPRSTKIPVFLHPKPTFWSDAVSCVHGSLQLLASKCCFFSLLFSPKVSLLHSGFGSIGKIQPIWSF